MKENIMHLFTRTPMHVGAGASVGAIDLPVMRERHTRFPIIPGSSLKGVLSALIEPEIGAEGGKPVAVRNDEAKWLFGHEDAKDAAAGALLVGEGSLLAFPVRSAKNAFAWLVSPLTLSRYARVAGAALDPPAFPVGHEHVCYGSQGVIIGEGKVVLEEYTFAVSGPIPETIQAMLGGIMTGDPVWNQMAEHLVLVTDGMLSFFAEDACEVATRVRIDDFTGTVAGGALFNQENVPSECMFFSAIGAQAEKGRDVAARKSPEEALKALGTLLAGTGNVLQVGGDETTGHGFCSVELKEAR